MWMFRKLTVVISSLCCTPWTYTVLCANYISIKLEEKIKNTPK